MESLRSKLSVSAMTINMRIFAEPRGLIRVLHFIFAVFAFATACSGSASVIINFQSGSDSVTASWSYPYNLENSEIVQRSNGTVLNLVSSSNSVAPSAIFFVFTGVTSMIIAVVFIIIYVIFDHQYRNIWILSIVDLSIIIIWSIFWIAGSCAWAKGIADIRSQTSVHAIVKRINICQTAGDCILMRCKLSIQLSSLLLMLFCLAGSYGSIISSVIFGFLNVFLWLSSIWFVYKETKFFKSRQEQRAQVEAPFPPSSFSNMNSPTMQSDPQFR